MHGWTWNLIELTRIETAIKLETRQHLPKGQEAVLDDGEGLFQWIHQQDESVVHVARTIGEQFYPSEAGDLEDAPRDGHFVSLGLPIQDLDAIIQ